MPFQKPKKEDLDLIRAKMLNPEEVPDDTIGVVHQLMADNEITSYNSVLSDEILQDFAFSLNEGRGGRTIPLQFNHARGYIPIGRSYRGEVVEVQGKKTSYGAPYKMLKGSFYGLKSGRQHVAKPGFITDNLSSFAIEDLAQKYHAGLLPAGSVGFKPNSAVCGVCSRDFGHADCEHSPGKSYEGRKAFVVLGAKNSAGAKGGVLMEYSFVGQGAVESAGPLREYVFSKDGDDIERLQFELGSDADSEAAAAAPQPSGTEIPTNITEHFLGNPGRMAEEMAYTLFKQAAIELDLKTAREEARELARQVDVLKAELSQATQDKNTLQEQLGKNVLDGKNVLVKIAKENHIRAFGQCPPEDLERYESLDPAGLMQVCADLANKFVELFASAKEQHEGTQGVEPEYNRVSKTASALAGRKSRR